MNRRRLLQAFAGATAALSARSPFLFGAGDAKKTSLGIVVYALGIRHRYVRSIQADATPDDPLSLLRFCHELGAGGIQVPLGVRAEADAARLRDAAEQRGMFIEGIAGLPQKVADIDRFEAQLSTASRSGARTVRVVMLPGRRYERFRARDEYLQFVRRGVKSLEWAEPVAARHRVRLALENHKDQRVDERLRVLRRISSEYLGACVDTGNSFALLEDPIEVVEAYAPYAFSVHLKDQAVQEYADGFLFSDAPLGEGFLDLKRMVTVLRKANPGIRFSLETITRDPLKVPCKTEDYWNTFNRAHREDLARTMQIVRNQATQHLLEISRLPLAEQVKIEENNVKQSLTYARYELGL